MVLCFLGSLYYYSFDYELSEEQQVDQVRRLQAAKRQFVVYINEDYSEQEFAEKARKVQNADLNGVSFECEEDLVRVPQFKRVSKTSLSLQASASAQPSASNFDPFQSPSRPVG
jgi:hypothetical protein